MTTTKLFITAAEVLPGDRLYKHGVTVASVSAPRTGVEGRPVVEFGYTHRPNARGTWLADRRFHVARKVAA